MTSRPKFDGSSKQISRSESSEQEQRLGDQDSELELSTLWNGVRRYLPQILLTTLFVGAGVYFWSKSQPNVYQASSSLVTTGSTTLNNIQTSMVTAPPLPQGALNEAMQGPIVLGEVIQRVKSASNLSIDERQKLSGDLQRELQDQRLKTLALNSRLDYNGNGIYTITAKGPTPSAATYLADTTAQALLDWDRSRALNGVRRAEKAFTAQLNEIDRQLADVKLTQLERDTLVSARASTQRNLAQAGIQAEGISGSLDLVSPAVSPLKPVAPKPTRNSVLAALLTLLLGVGIATLRIITDRTARSEDDLVNFGLPTLGTIPRLRKRDVVFNGIVRAAREAGLYEAIGFLRVNLLSRLGTQPGKKVMISSTAPGEGKSSLTATLADGLASSGQRVLIIDADMRRGTQQSVWEKYETEHQWLQLTGVGGARTLQEALVNPNNVQVMEAEPNVHVLPAGPGIQDSLGLLNRTDVSECMKLWAKDYDIVLVDSPPLLAIADGLVLGRAMDAVLLVVEEGQTTLQAIQRSLRRAGNSDLNMLGFILNKVSPNSEEGRSYGYSYGYSPKGSQ